MGLSVLLLTCSTGCDGPAHHAISRLQAPVSTANRGFGAVDRFELLGATREEVAAFCDSPGRIQFIVRRNGHVYHCIRHQFHQPYFVSHLLVFKDRELISIIDPDSQSDAGGRSGSRFDAETKVSAVLNSPGLSQEQFAEKLSSDLEGWIEYRAHPGDNDLSLMYIQLVPLMALFAPVRIPILLAEADKLRRWTETYDPRRIELGFSTRQVEDLYGPPGLSSVREDKEFRAYGPMATRDTPDFEYEFRMYWVVVEYRQGLVTGIYCHDFYPFEAIAGGTGKDGQHLLSPAGD